MSHEMQSDDEAKDILDFNAIDKTSGGLSPDDAALLAEGDEKMVSMPESQLLALTDRLDNLEKSTAAMTKKMSGGMAQNMDAIRRIVSKRERDTFLNTQRPLTEVFSWNPYAFYNLHPGCEQVSTHGTKKRIPGLVIDGFTQWNGPGSEFPNPHFGRMRRTGGPRITMGRKLIHQDRIVTVTKEDIERFNLPPDTLVQAGVTDIDGHSYYTVEMIVDILHNRDDLDDPNHMITGAVMQSIVGAMYEADEHRKRSEAHVNSLIANARKDRLKTGHIGALEDPVAV